MPLVYRSELPCGILALWEITEESAQLAALCSEEERTYAATFPTEARRREWLSWHALLHAVAPNVQTGYNEAGAPVTDTGHISVSHTPGFCAVMLAPVPCGVDIEHTQRNFTKAAKRFLSETERTLTPCPDNGFLCRIWCAKEALFKQAGIAGLDFLHDIRITAWDPAAQTMEAEVRGTAASVRLLIRDGLCIAFCPGK